MVRLWVGLCLALIVLSTQAGARERILAYEVDIEILSNGRIHVVENITVMAEGDAINRGIYRDFPVLYKGLHGERVRVAFDVLEVRRNGRVEPYHIEKSRASHRLYIGDSGVFIDHGEHRYTIEYETNRQVGHFENHDELYWNVTGNDWLFPIDAVRAVLHPPEGAVVERAEAFTGFFGQTGSRAKVSFLSDGGVKIESTGPLVKGQGVTFVAAWPKGFVEPPTTNDFLIDNGFIFIGLLGIFLTTSYFVFVWHRHGRDPVKGPEVPRYEPPKGFSAAAMRYVSHMGYDDKAYTVALVSLAVKGALQIKQEDDEFSLILKNRYALNLSKGERAVLRVLFPKGVGQELPLSNDYASVFKSGAAALANALEEEFSQQYFRLNKELFFIGFFIAAASFVSMGLFSPAGTGALVTMAIAVALMSAAAVIFHFLWKSWIAMKVRRGIEKASSIFSVIKLIVYAMAFSSFSIFAAGALYQDISLYGALVGLSLFMLCLVFYQLMKAPTLLGQRVLDHIHGFRLFLSLTEKDRLEFLNPPDKTSELFEKFLPHAIALEVENQWGEAFEDVVDQAGAEGAIYTPHWYSGPHYRRFSAAAFSRGLSGSFTTALHSASTPPASSSSSGFSGGFSGGGGGGGGGGGW